MTNIRKNFGEAYYQSMPTLAEAMVEVLKLFPHDDVYGVSGDYAAALTVALDSALSLCPSSNEANAAFSACASAELTGMGFCLVTYTVGSLPCASAAALAKSERLPVVFLSGAPGEGELNEAAMHHSLCRSDSWSFDYDNALHAFRALDITAERLQGQRNPDQPNIAGEQFYRLVTHAFAHREPVFIEVPRDIVHLKTQALRLPASIDEVMTRESAFDGQDLITEHIRSKLEQSETPLVYIGEKVKLNKPFQEILLAFCHKFRIPYATNIYAKGIFDDGDPLNVGTYNGVFSLETTRRFVEGEVDLILEVGTSTYTQDVSNALNTGTHRIAEFPNKIAIIGTSLLERDEMCLFAALVEMDLRPHEVRLPTRPRLEAATSSGTLGVHNLYHLLHELQTTTDDTFIYLPEVGSALFSSFNVPTRRSELGRSWLTNSWYGAMGTALPYARAACRLLKQKGSTDVPIVVIGDGGFHSQCNELIHFLRDELFAILLYLNNGVFEFGRCSDSRFYECSDERFDVSVLARAYGGQGASCRTPEKFGSIMREALSTRSGLWVIDIQAEMTRQYENRELQIFSTYIKSKAGDPQATHEWEELVERTECSGAL